MKQVIKIVVATGCILILLFIVLKWRRAQQFSDTVTLTADFMQYACGECTLDMQVLKVDNWKYNFILKDDIFPIPRSKHFSQLCNFIIESYYTSRFNKNEPIQYFTLIGKLHRYSGGLFGNCSETRYFTVERIKYGNGKWANF